MFADTAKDLDALHFVHVHFVALQPDQTSLIDDTPVGDCDLSDPPLVQFLDQKSDRNERERI